MNRPPAEGASELEIRDQVTAPLFHGLCLFLQAKRRMKFIVLTGSMLPLIEIGSQVEVEPLADLPRRFDIHVFWDGQKLICHYLWHINEIRDPGEPRQFVTRAMVGGEDLPVPEDRVLGRVTNFSIPAWFRFQAVFRAVLRRG